MYCPKPFWHCKTLIDHGPDQYCFPKSTNNMNTDSSSEDTAAKNLMIHHDTNLKAAYPQLKYAWNNRHAELAA
jgi:hypothetical protein